MRARALPPRPARSRNAGSRAAPAEARVRREFIVRGAPTLAAPAGEGYPSRVRRPRSWALPLLFWALSCESGAAATNPPEPVAATAPEASAPLAEVEVPADEEAAAKTARITKRSMEIADALAAARELTRTRDFAVELIDREGVREFVLTEMHEDMPPEKLHLLGRVESSLGVFPVGADAEQILLDLYQDGVLGIYDPKRKTLLIGDYVPERDLDMVVGHEIAHALQDMHFDLEALQEPVDGQSDRDAAKTFLVEGGAQAAFTVWAMRGPPRDEDIRHQLLMADRVLELAGQVSKYGVLIRMLQMPYTDGTATVMAAIQARGWKVIDGLYARLPVSSEQMLHVDKLLADEQPRAIDIKRDKFAEALPEHVEVWEDELGEAFLLAALSEVAPANEAREAAAGWDGDRFLAFDRKDQPDAAPIVVGFVAWDSTRDAEEFEDLFEVYLERTKGDRFRLERRGDRVVYAVELSPDLQKTVTRAAWRGFDPGARPDGVAR